MTLSIRHRLALCIVPIALLGTVGKAAVPEPARAVQPDPAWPVDDARKGTENGE